MERDWTSCRSGRVRDREARKVTFAAIGSGSGSGVRRCCLGVVSGGLRVVSRVQSWGSVGGGGCFFTMWFESHLEEVYMT